jgi:hypothetical protein
VKPGIYQMDAAAYHADPCPTPSLSAGMINHMLTAPALCRFNSSRLNPDYVQPEDDGKFTIGSVSHVMFLEPEQAEASVVIVDADDWRTKDAKAARKDAADQGKTAILTRQWEQVLAARASFVSDPFIAAAFTNGKPELSMFWKHPSGIWCRARPDWIPDSGAYLCDYKTTANANPENFGRHAYNLGYHRRAAWYLDGYATINGKEPAHYWFVNQEPKPPFLTSVTELDMHAIEAGRQENERAVRLFAKCLEADHWPGYSDTRAVRVGLPNYAYMQIDGRLAMPEEV